MEQAVRYHNNGASQLLRTSTTEERELFQQRLKSFRARPDFEPGISRTRSENHTPRPNEPIKIMERMEIKIILEGFLGQHTVGKVFFRCAQD